MRGNLFFVFRSRPPVSNKSSNLIGNHTDVVHWVLGRCKPHCKPMIIYVSVLKSAMFMTAFRLNLAILHFKWIQLWSKASSPFWTELLTLCLQNESKVFLTSTIPGYMTASMNLKDQMLYLQTPMIKYHWADHNTIRHNLNLCLYINKDSRILQ